MAKKVLTLENMNPNMIKLQYAVRGPLVIRSVEIIKELKKGVKKPFKQVIRANIGDAHAMGQKPITFIRQVLASVIDPKIMDKSGYPADVKERAKQLLSAFNGGSVGSYSMSTGVEQIRRHVAEFIERRDGHPSDYNNVCLVNGASTGIKNILELFCACIDGKKSGIMIPTPQYPLYSATIAEFDLEPVPYYLDEDNNWALDIKELKRALDEARSRCNVRALVIINPGNPTGQVLPCENIVQVLEFAHENHLLLFADEVYQHNVYEGEFHSFKKVMMDMGGSIAKNQELASFVSVSKGYMGECGLRGGWMELVNFQPKVQEHLYKVISASLCAAVTGQVAADCVAKPPQQGDPSYELWKKEKDNVIATMAERAKLAVGTFQKMPGFKCNNAQGAMYVFPRFELSPKAIEAAKKKNMPPDTFYAFQLLEEAGICIIPGSGFGQRPGTWHFRTTILPPTEMLKEMLGIFQQFHEKFTKQYA